MNAILWSYMLYTVQLVMRERHVSVDINTYFTIIIVFTFICKIFGVPQSQFLSRYKTNWAGVVTKGDRLRIAIKWRNFVKIFSRLILDKSLLWVKNCIDFVGQEDTQMTFQVCGIAAPFWICRRIVDAPDLTAAMNQLEWWEHGFAGYTSIVEVKFAKLVVFSSDTYGIIIQLYPTSYRREKTRFVIRCWINSLISITKWTICFR